jgi:hypothetical protein
MKVQWQVTATMDFVLEVIVRLQGDGMKARAWGLSTKNNPALIQAEPIASRDADWWQRHDAWLFGWEVEDAWLQRSLY